MNDRHEIERVEPIENPGLPEHLPRPTDVDPKQERRAELQVSGMFGLAGLLALAFCVFYFMIDLDQTFLNWSALNVALGATLGLSLIHI